MLLLLNSPAENDWGRSNTLCPLAVHSHLGQGLIVISGKERNVTPPRGCLMRGHSPSPTCGQVSPSLMGNLTIIWISLLHTWRSCSLLTNMRFKAHFIPLLVLTRNTMANPPGGEAHTGSCKSRCRRQGNGRVAADCWCHCWWFWRHRQLGLGLVWHKMHS